MSATVNINGHIVDEEHARVSVFDHGFLYGEGIYETLRTYNGEPFLFGRHMRRLRTSASMLNLLVPIDDRQIADRVRDTLLSADLGTGGAEAYIRILVTRGVGELSYDPAACPRPTFVVIVKPQVNPPEEAYDQGVAVVLASIVRNHPGSVNPIIKSNNLLNNALAMQEAVRLGAFEAVMRNYRGELAEGTTANIFIVKDGAVWTPPLASGLLAGITREFLFEVWRQLGIAVGEQVLRDEDLFGADEAFLTSTTREIVPIVRVDDRIVAGGRPGPVTRALLDRYRAKAEELTAVARGR